MLRTLADFLFSPLYTGSEKVDWGFFCDTAASFVLLFPLKTAFTWILSQDHNNRQNVQKENQLHNREKLPVNISQLVPTDYGYAATKDIKRFI